VATLDVTNLLCSRLYNINKYDQAEFHKLIQLEITCLLCTTYIAEWYNIKMKSGRDSSNNCGQERSHEAIASPPYVTPNVSGGVHFRALAESETFPRLFMIWRNWEEENADFGQEQVRVERILIITENVSQ
jgi:hypothetical protein